MPVLCIDAGHGGPDPGARDPYNNITEASVNLKVAKELARHLARHGAKHVLLRDSDKRLIESDGSKDLDARVVFGDKNATHYLSIHCNAHSNTSARGPEIFTVKKGSQGDKMAVKIFEGYLDETGLGRFSRGIKHARFRVLTGSIPSALIELEFMTHKDGAQFLKDEWKTAAVGLAKGWLKFIGQEWIPEEASQSPDVDPVKKVLYRVILDGVQKMALSTKEAAIEAVDKGIREGAKSGKVQTTEGEDVYTVHAKPVEEPVKIYGEPILGENKVSYQQMAAFLLSKNPDPKIGCSAEDLAFIFSLKGKETGVRGDIAFCQSMHETGFFRFGGQVLPEQNNFAGIGATNNSPVGKGAWFDTVSIGVTAQMHHLLAYASKERVENPVSPRYDLVLKTHGIASAPTWEMLSGKWAVPGYDPSKFKTLEEATTAGENYGQKILKLYEEMKAFVIPDPDGKIVQDFIKEMTGIVKEMDETGSSLIQTKSALLALKESLEEKLDQTMNDIQAAEEKIKGTEMRMEKALAMLDKLKK